MGKASVARSGSGMGVSKSSKARGGNVTLSKALPASMVAAKSEGSVTSNIPGAGPQGVPDVTAKDGEHMARAGNADQAELTVQMARGQVTYGPQNSSAVARTGGQVGLSPNQVGAWSQKSGS